MSMTQRGHFKIESSAAVADTAAAPQCGQCLLPMNSIPKQEAQATVASFDSQYWHCGASDEIAAPQFGQLRVCAGIGSTHPRGWQASRRSDFTIRDTSQSTGNSAGRTPDGCAMLTLHPVSTSFF